MKSILIFAFLAALLLAPLAAAQIGYYCVSGNSFHNWTLDGEVHNMTEPCRFSCIQATGTCADESSDPGVPISLILGYIGIAAILAYLSTSIDREQHGLIQVIFIIMSLFMMLGALGAVRSILDSQGVIVMDSLVNSIITGFMWVVYMVLFYLFLVFIKNLFEMWNQRENKRLGRGL